MILEKIVLNELQRIQFDYENSDITVKCLKTLDEFDLGEKKVKLAKGATIKLPFWLADILEKEEYVEFTEPLTIDLPKLYKIANRESDKMNALQKIDSFFYLTIKRTFEEYKKKDSIISYREQEAMKVKIRELMQLRLSKIIKMSEKEFNVAITTRNLTPEEQWLYKAVYQAVNRWKKMVNISDRG
ncbi:MAG: hypothetical protein ACTSSG_03920 [Candidatus Heimdallarchaeaceae archaeon]